MPARVALALLALSLSAGGVLAQAPPEDFMGPFEGTWRINYELSYLRALADKDLPERDPTNLSEYIGTMSRIIELSIADSLIHYTRGRHELDFGFEFMEQHGDTLVVRVDPGGQGAVWELSLDEDGTLYILSTATRMNDFYVYERGEIPRNEQGLPIAMPGRQPQSPMGLPVEQPEQGAPERRNKP